MPVNRILSSVSENVDAANGNAGLTPGMRARLLTEQLRAIVHMTPTMVAGSVAISVLIVVMSMRSSVFPVMAIWAVCLYATLLMGMRAWLRQRQGLSRTSSPLKGKRRATLNALILGTIWGVVPLILMPVPIVAVKLTAGIATAGVLCASVFTLSVLPAVAMAFAAPLILGSIAGLARLGDISEAAPLIYLVLIFAGVMPFIVSSLSKSFVERLASEAQISDQKNIISLLLKEFEANSSDWLWEFDRDGHMQRVSDRFSAAARKSADDLVGRDFCAFFRLAHKENAALIDEIAHDIEHRQMFQDVEVRIRDGEIERCWKLTGKPIYDESGGYAGYFGTASDVTAAKEAERRINFLAHNDALTGLLNRGKFTEHLKQAVARLERYGSPFAVLFLDLDQFKSVNDSRGHLVGDKLLVQVGKRIRSAMRDTDIIARLGGDEFAILLSSKCENEEIARLAARLVDVVGKPYEIDDELVTIGLSVGIALAPMNGTRPDQLLRNADLALYRAKAEGRGVYRFFESQMDSDVRERRMLEIELREAIKNGEFVLHYQPLISTEHESPSGFEALVRWNHPIRGIVPPAEFIPIAEQTGLIMQIGDWTILEACNAAAQWPGDMLVAVNLSAKHFQMSDITAVVRNALELSGLSPHRLELEITESLLIDRPDDVIIKLAELKDLGVTIAMDDFGTGYSSLSYLLKFPFDKIKIDKSFVTASSEDAVARDILRSIASLGKTLKIKITAEGVETQEQVDFLRDIACHHLQGFYFAKPLDETAMAHYLLTDFHKKMQDGDANGGNVVPFGWPIALAS